MNLEDQLRTFRLADPPAALETRILAEVRGLTEETAAPSWMRSPAWAAGFAVLTLVLAAWIGAPDPAQPSAQAKMLPQEREAEYSAVLVQERALLEAHPRPQGSKPEARVEPERLLRTREPEYAS